MRGAAPIGKRTSLKSCIRRSAVDLVQEHESPKGFLCEPKESLCVLRDSPQACFACGDVI